jgi:glycosyltransferase involved in cell wall biosynthesis
MKIALISHVLPPSWSGQSVMIGRILRAVSPDQYCLISTENYQNQESQNTQRLPGTYYVLPPDPKIKGSERHWILAWLRAFIRGRNIARIVNGENSTAVVAASGNLIDIPAGWWASILAGVEFIPYLFDDYLYQWPDQQTRAITRKMESLIYGRVRKVIVPNEFMRDEIEKRHRNVKAFIVRNPCASLPAGGEQTDRLEYDLHNEIRIVYTGAIYHVNFDAFRNLIAAVEQIAPNIKIHLFTAQPVEWLEANGIKSRQIVLHSHTIHVEVLKAQNQAHILFLPFAFNSTIPEVIKSSAPGKTGEYLASGVPILAHVPGDSFVSWYLKTHECGLVVDVNDVEVLKEAILKLSNNAELRNKLTVNARERACTDFDPLVASRAFVQALETTL